MFNHGVVYPVVLFSGVLLFCLCRAGKPSAEMSDKREGAFYTGKYPDLFVTMLDQDSVAVQEKVALAFRQLFYGDSANERVYYPVEPDMAYIKDILHSDVRSEGMSYGMMIAVQLDRKAEFDRLWKWAKTYMQHQTGDRSYYFAWQVGSDGEIMDPNSASDGEEYFVMSLLFAAARWGNGGGIYNYQAEAQNILDAMLNKTEFSNSDTVITNMFNKEEKQVVFVPVGNADDFTDPSYHLPHFYECWALWTDKNQTFWQEAAAVSREFLKRAVHPQTGLVPDYANFDGSPRTLNPNDGHADFRFDAWRVAMNISLDHIWFHKDPWAVEQNNRWLAFFSQQGIDNYGNQYTLDGKPLSHERSTGLAAMNAAACLASTRTDCPEFVRALWDMPVPDGIYRYYDGLLYMLAMLSVSGNMRVYHLQ